MNRETQMLMNWIYVDDAFREELISIYRKDVEKAAINISKYILDALNEPNDDDMYDGMKRDFIQVALFQVDWFEVVKKIVLFKNGGYF